ncbi:MAG: TetR/AcrR family transcriptional regulator [Acidimicrobiales bacterium]
MTEAQDETQVDGRTARAMRTRDAIVASCVALVDAGDLRPTAPRIAEGAGVSVRSVFQHFDDLETLFDMVADQVLGRLAQLYEQIDPTLPLDDRIDRFVRQRRSLLEAVTPIRRAAALHAPFSRVITKRLRAGHDFLRADIATVFADQLQVVRPGAREQLLDVLDTAVSWPTWESLRTLNGRDSDEAAAVLRRMLTMALASATG